MGNKVMRVSNILSEEGNPFMKRHNQKERYASIVWPISELQHEDAKVNVLEHIGDDKIGKAFAELAFIIHDAKEGERAARTELAKSREEVREEFKAEIEALQDQLNRSYMRLSHKEEEAYKAFTHKHYMMHNGGRFKADTGITVHMAGTGVGTCYTLECPVCHETEDITDVMSW